MKKIYVCSDTVTGIYSAIYDAWQVVVKDKNAECGIALKGALEQELFCEYYPVTETEQKARAVAALIRKHLGARAYEDISLAVLSCDCKKGDAILGTMIAARQLRDSQRIMDHLSHPQVEKVFELSRNVGGEGHNYKGFLRFQELQNGILYSGITPKNHVLPYLAPHFADRLPQENWMIHDKTHQMFAVHEAGKAWVMVWNEGTDPRFFENISEREQEFAKLWKGFCRSIAIESRRNPRCQLQHLPLRYRADMTEGIMYEELRKA